MLTGAEAARADDAVVLELSRPSPWIRSTEISLLPASTASRCFPSRVIWSAPCEPMP